MDINDIDAILVEIHGAYNSIQENVAACINDDSITNNYEEDSEYSTSVKEEKSKLHLKIKSVI